jgi:hypothetical protein
MKRNVLTILALVFVAAGVGMAAWWQSAAAARRAGGDEITRAAPSPPSPAVAPALPRPSAPAPPGPAPVPSPAAALEAAKAARIARIERDYEEMKAKITADYTASITGFPGGLNALLRQQALLDREKYRDLAAFLTPRELEDVEMQDSGAGQRVRRLLGDTAATEEQRRAVFRAQEAFDDEYAYTFDTTPAFLLARWQAQQQAQEAILAALGNNEALTAAWLRGDGRDDAAWRAFLTQQGLPPAEALDLWRAKNDYMLHQLELNAQPGLTPEQVRAARASLAEATQARLLAILGPNAFQAVPDGLLGWFPHGK